MIRSGTLPTLAAIAAFVVGGLVLSSVAVVAMRTTAVSTAGPMLLEDLGRRVLVIAPHPDDEVLATGGTIHRLVESGARVQVVVVTAGDSYRRAAERIAGGRAGTDSYLELGDVRHRESVAAAARLGLAPDDVISLGYADGTTASMWDACWDAATPAQGRTQATAVPYPWAQNPGSALCGDELSSQLAAIIDGFGPDTIITPDVYETHADHAMVATFATYAMDEAGYTGRRLSTVVHFRHYPYPWAHLPALALNPPPQLLADGTTWLALPLSAGDNKAKAAAIAEYRSQTAIADLGLYMRAFIRTNELFASRPAVRVRTLADDEPPTPGSAATVALTPRPVVPPAPGSTRPRISGIDMARGPHTLWIGLRCDAKAATSRDTFGIGLRLFGGTDAPVRLDVSVRGSEVTVLRSASDSIAPAGVAALVDGDMLWVSVPADALSGRTRCMVGASAVRGSGTPMRTAWREADL